MPYLVCNPYPSTVLQPTQFELVMDNGPVIVSPIQTVSGGVRLHHDVSAVSVGNHSVSVKAVRIDTEWGRLESAPAPFAFTKPASPAVPGGVKLEV